MEVQGGLGAEGIRFGDGDPPVQGPTWKQDILAATSIHLASTHLQAYRTYLSTNLETYRTYKPVIYIISLRRLVASEGLADDGKRSEVV